MTRRHLNALIDAALAEYGDPAAATAAVLAQMSEADRADALALTLPAYVATRRATARPQAEANQFPASNDRPPRPAAPRPSAKVAAIRDAWAARIERDEYWVDGRRIALADLTREQVLTVAASNRELAAKVEASADRLERVAAAMAEHGARTVADLPSEVGLAAWRAAA